MVRAVFEIHLIALLFLGSPATAASVDHAKICEAIQRGWEVRVVYRTGEGERVIVPRFLGYTKDRNVILNGIQISGFSASGKIPGHRSFRLDRATDIKVIINSTPIPRGGGRPPSMVDLICGVT
jgi:hypothetical protein